MCAPCGLARCRLLAAGCWLTLLAGAGRAAVESRAQCAVSSVECSPHQYFSSPNARAPKPGGRPLVRVRVTNPNQCSRVGGRRSAVSHRGSPGPPLPGGRVPIIATRRRPGPQAPAGCEKDLKVQPLTREAEASGPNSHPACRRPGSVRCHRAAQAMTGCHQRGTATEGAPLNDKIKWQRRRAAVEAC